MKNYNLKMGSDYIASENESVLLVPHLAKFIHQTPAAIYSLVHRGMIPFHKMVKRLYFLKSEILAWIKGEISPEDSNDETLRNLKPISLR